MAGASTTLIAALAAFAAGTAQPGAPVRDPLVAASEAIAAALVPIGLAGGLVEACRDRDPGGAPGRAAALAAWRRANGVARFEAAVGAVAARAPELAAGQARMQSAAAAQAAETVSADPAACHRLSPTLAEPQYRIAPVTAAAIPVLQQLAASLDGRSAPLRRHAAR